MTTLTKRLYGFCLLFFVLLPSDCAPRSKNSRNPSPQTIYDQKQTGDYNIQLHLKDFQIIALLADDPSSLGDYDYSYDYSDFTVKPGTQKPIELIPPPPPPAAPLPNSSYSLWPQSSQATSETSRPTISNYPYPILSSNTTTEAPKEKPYSMHQSPNETKPTEANTVSLNATKEGSSTFTSSGITTQKSAKFDDSNSNSPGKIKVQIIETPAGLSIVPGEDIQEQNDAVPPGDILHVRKCAAGFTRDKRGRCRRVRKPGTVSPQLFGFSRLASNLASRFNKNSPNSSSSSSSSSESTED